MVVKKIAFILISAGTLIQGAYWIDPQPLCTIYTPNSILQNKAQYKPLYIGDRIRYATCTGVAWFHTNYLAILNVYGRKIETYHFDRNTATVTPLQTIIYPDIPLIHAANLNFSPDGSLLAIVSDQPHAGVTLYRVDKITHKINPTPICSEQPIKGLVHNVRFTSDGQYVALAVFDTDAIIMYKLMTNEKKTSLTRISSQKASNMNRAKAIQFSSDNQFALVVYAPPVKPTSHRLESFDLYVYEFNTATGCFGNIVDHVTNHDAFGAVEDMALLPDGIILSIQGRDALIIYPFDHATGKIDRTYTTIEDAQAQLSFPHGMSTSSDGTLLAVTNYGDDKCNIYRINNWQII